MRKDKVKKDFLLEAIPRALNDEKKGRVLDLGCGEGHHSFNLKNAGFDVTGVDVAGGSFKYHDSIPFKEGNIYEGLPFQDSVFDYVLFIETIEHLEKPFEAVQEIGRVLKKGGKLIISTPNILNLSSRFRFLFEGSWDFFREPPADQQRHYIGTIENLHIIPWRYHELEYMLLRKGFSVEKVYTDFINNKFLPLFWLMSPFLQLIAFNKNNRSKKKGGVDYTRINQICLSKEVLLGKHLILKAVNTKQFAQAFGYYKKEK